MAGQETIRYGKQEFPVLDHITVGNRSYAILRKIGNAGRQRFWVCERRTGPRKVFRQILILPGDKTTRQHLDVLQRISQGNPNFPMILDCRRNGADFQLVTTWIHGEDLRSFLRRTQADRHGKNWPSPLEVMKLYRGLAHGLSQLHRHFRVVHGDIKPENLIFAKSPNRLVCIDYGSGWTMERTVARVKGDGISEYYTAPEQQAEDVPADFRSDQFSATVVAYEMLTGKLPYGGMGGKAGLPDLCPEYEPLYQPPSRLCPLSQAVPRRIWELIDAAVAQGLALDPTKRFQNRSQWIDALEDIHCETRRKAHFTFWEKYFLRFIDRYFSKDKMP